MKRKLNRPKKNSSLRVSVNRKLRLDFRKDRLIHSATIHPSYRHENRHFPVCRNLENFDRLEFFGDAILNYVVCRKLYASFPDADEGLLSRLRSILVSRKILGRIARKIGLRSLLKLGRGILNDKNHAQSKLFVDALEALFGAYYLDRGLSKTERFILRLYEGYFDVKKLIRIDPNPKSTLQELAQKHWQVLPVYKNEPHTRGIRCAVSVRPDLKATAESKTRRDAEEKAARILIRKLRQDLLRRSKKSSSGKK